MKRYEQIKITQEDFQHIMGNDWNFFQEKIVHNCLYHYCNGPYNATITNYDVFLNDLNDILLKGFCKTCGNPIARYIETGDGMKHKEAINDIRKKYARN